MIINVKKADYILLPIENMSHSLKKGDKLKGNEKTSFGTFLSVNSTKKWQKTKIYLS